ncbi:MAG: hypothetical protein ACK56F_25390 [bacterium]
MLLTQLKYGGERELSNAYFIILISRAKRKKEVERKWVTKKGGERKYVKIMERVGASEERCGEKMGKEKKIPKPRNETKEKKAMRSTNIGNM